MAALPIQLTVYAVDLMLIFVAIIRILTIPARRWPHGHASKLAWIAAAIWFTVGTGAVVIPFGAAAAIWRTRSMRKRRQQEMQQFGVPFAKGTPRSDHGQDQR